MHFQISKVYDEVTPYAGSACKSGDNNIVN